jgi:hypothetical protein
MYRTLLIFGEENENKKSPACARYHDYLFLPLRVNIVKIMTRNIFAVLDRQPSDFNLSSVFLCLVAGLAGKHKTTWCT